MKNLLILLFSLVSFFGFSQNGIKEPSPKTTFSKEALAQKVVTIDKSSKSIKQILAKHKGKTIFLDLWASWCKDCVANIEGVKKLEHENPNVVFIYLSLDRKEEPWKEAIKKYDLKRGEHYWFKEGWKNPFTAYIDLNWIPRYMIIDKTGKIAMYYAVEPEDDRIQKALGK